MNSNFAIFSENSSGEKIELIFSQTFLLVSKLGEVEIKLPPEANNWTIKLNFTGDDSVEELTATRTFSEGNIISYKLNKWYSDTWAENSVPWTLEAKDKKTVLYIKVRSSSQQSRNNRLVYVSIWKKKT